MNEVKEEVVTKESAEDLLSRLIEEDKEHTENARYILAVMLERKKLLKETDKQQTPNGILRIYEHRKSGEIYIVLDPNIPLDQIEEVQKEVSELLDGNDKKEDAANSDTEAVGLEEVNPEEEADAQNTEAGNSDASCENPKELENEIISDEEQESETMEPE